MADSQVVVEVTVPATDPLSTWWAGKKAPKSQPLNEQLAGSLLITEGDIPQEAPVLEPVPQPAQPTEQRTRKRRSDAGIPKGPKLVETAAAGAVSKEQRSRLLMAVGLVQQTTRELMLAEISFQEKRKQLEQAEKDLAACLDALSLAGTQ